ncbi:hypothetical protein SVA_2145 [Sulfurifustis variabilis]|uniref:Uncharacterized protein n=1 Tax=Sulfurifustis variabilis TaxID=1675686 RepID=A0A1B4V5J4_9GAMM|nr:hypothetical protein [Sulfurifustis variabilis]BAU48695.1 hypothetical protein SVA_2145 [Sulfurifustis variabilis]
MIGAPTFYTALQGRFSGILHWEELTSFWALLRERADNGWYIYAVGESVPARPRSGDEVRRFIDAVDALLREDHREDYCGIVYTDSRDEPTIVKVFDPHHLGVSCGFSKNPPLPGWILSRIPPLPVNDKRVLPEGRRRWWRALWSD